jgi:FtsH-binding integral membrane protein
MKSARSLELMMWVGVVAAPAAWACQHVFGFGVTVAGCGSGSHAWMVPIDSWTVIAGSVAAALAIGGLVASVITLRAVSAMSKDDPPPGGRIYFMSVCGIVISPLFLAIIVMSTVATAVLSNCHPG